MFVGLVFYKFQNVFWVTLGMVLMLLMWLGDCCQQVGQLLVLMWLLLMWLGDWCQQVGQLLVLMWLLLMWRDDMSTGGSAAGADGGGGTAIGAGWRPVDSGTPCGTDCCRCPAQSSPPHCHCSQVCGTPRQTCLVYAIGVEIYTFEAQTTHLRLHYTNYTNDFVLATR